MEPFKLVLNCEKGWGKTSTACYAPDPTIIMCGNETGYRTLRALGRVPDIIAGHAQTWPDLLELIAQITTQTIVLDALGGAERICMEYVCDTHFKSEWGEYGFASYGKGMNQVLVELTKLMSLLDRSGKNVIICAHPRVKTFQNPVGPDFDRYEADCDQTKTWPTVQRWADSVLFGKFFTATKKEGRADKGIGDDRRVLYTTKRDAWEAGNRYGMPDMLTIPKDPAQVWPTIFQYMQPKKG